MQSAEDMTESAQSKQQQGGWVNEHFGGLIRRTGKQTKDWWRRDVEIMI